MIHRYTENVLISINQSFYVLHILSNAMRLFLFFPFGRVTKDHFVFHGINTEFFQAGTQLKSKTPINLPWKLTLKMNVKQRKFEIDMTPIKKVTELFGVK